MTYVNIDISFDDILSGMTSNEKQRLADDLYTDGYYQSELEKEIQDAIGHGLGMTYAVGMNEQIFREQVFKLGINYLNLTNEEQEVILKVAKRF